MLSCSPEDGVGDWLTIVDHLHPFITVVPVLPRSHISAQVTAVDIACYFGGNSKEIWTERFEIQGRNFHSQDKSCR